MAKARRARIPIAMFDVIDIEITPIVELADDRQVRRIIVTDDFGNRLEITCHCKKKGDDDAPD